MAHPLPEVLLLVVCGTIASCDDFDDIAAWGEAHLSFLRRFLPYHYGVPGARWLSMLMNRIDPALFSACFMAWARELRPDAPELIAIDGKTSRRSHDRTAGKAALHLVSAFATRERLVLGQEAVAESATRSPPSRRCSNGSPRPARSPAPWSRIDAIACNPSIAKAIVDARRRLPARRQGQPAEPARRDRALLRRRAPAAPRHHRRARQGPWPHRGARLPPSPARSTGSTASAASPASTASPSSPPSPWSRPGSSAAAKSPPSGATTSPPRPLTAEQLAEAVRAHWRIENSLHWVLDVTFREDLARVRKGHGAKNMAVVRHFAINIVRTADDKLSLKTRRKLAGWDPDYLATLLSPSRR